MTAAPIHDDEPCRIRVRLGPSAISEACPLDSQERKSVEALTYALHGWTWGERWKIECLTAAAQNVAAVASRPQAHSLSFLARAERGDSLRQGGPGFERPIRTPRRLFLVRNPQQCEASRVNDG